MRQYFLMIIAGLVAVIMGLFTIPFQGAGDRGQGTGAETRYTASLQPTCITSQQPVYAVDSALGNPAIRVSNPVPKPNSGSEPGPEPNSAPAPLPLLPPEAMTEVSPSQLPPLDAGMVNVTGDAQLTMHNAQLTMHNAQLTMHNVQLGGGGADDVSQAGGYRMVLLSANSEYQITIPYDPTLLPQGFTEDDIQTYVYDQQYHRWVAIQRDSVNMEELLVCSRFRPWEKALPGNQEDMSNPQDVLAQVQGMMSMNAQGDGGGDSPLDFINAVLKTPEMPETSAYTPTSIKELKAADPLEGLTLMQPPTANNSGTANMSYPIEIPAGRQGMQPNLALTYSSGGGNGWLGVGWDISIPSITVETRWGVPRYDSQKESEVYVYEGEQLVTYDSMAGDFRKLPHRTNQWTSRYDLDYDGYEQFYPRKNEAFDSIVRHGNDPSNYWWSVTHKNGVTDYYGKRHGVQAADHGSVLCDPTTNNIAQWMLTESVDPFGNWVRYYYKKEHEKSVASSLLSGTQVYIDSIVYTGYDTTGGEYSVRFNRNGGRRDVITNGRYGFREVTASTLCNVEVLFGEEILHRYYFVTENCRESSYKTRLTDLVRMDPPIQDAGCNNILDPSYWIEEDEGTDIEGSFGKANIMRYNFSYYDYPDDDTLFGGTVEIDNLVDDHIQSSFDDGAHAATALGATSSKDWSVGGTVGFGIGADVSSSRDGVGGNFSYSRSRSKGLLSLVDLDGDGRSDKVYKRNGTVYYRKNIADDEYHFHYGNEVELEGVADFLDVVGNTPSFGIQGHFMVFNVSGSIPVSVSDTRVYFSDVNGDGLPDIVTDGGVLFNNIDNNGNVYFASFYTLAQPNPDDPGDYSYVVTSSFGDCNGGIIYDGAVNEDISCDIDYDYVTIPVSECNLAKEMETLIDSGYSVVSYTDSSITYLASDSVRIDCEPVGNEPDMDAVRVWVAPCDGFIHLNSTTSLIYEESETNRQGRHSNGVVFSVQHNQTILPGPNYALLSAPPMVYCRDTIVWGDSGVHTLDTLIYVTENDLLFFRLQSRGHRIADKVLSHQHISYSKFDCEVMHYDSDSDFVLTGKSYFMAPKSGNVRVSGTFLRRWASSVSGCTVKVIKNSTDVYSTNVGTGTFIKNINLSFLVNRGDSVRIMVLPSNPLVMDWGSISFQPRLEFEDDWNDTSLVMGDVLYCYPPAIMPIFDLFDDPVRYHLRNWFGPLYKGWGQFAYNNNFPHSADLPIDVMRLVIPKVITGDNTDFNETNLSNTINDSNYSIDTSGTEPTSDFTVESLSSDFDNLYNPLSDSTSWVAMIPYGEYGAYMGFGNTTAIFSSEMDNTHQPVILTMESDENENDYDENGQFVEEIPEYDDVIPVSVDGSEAKTIRKRSVSTMGNLGAGISEPNLSLSLSVGDNLVNSDFIDLNGDRFPDILVKNTAQYTMPWGGLETGTHPVGEDKHVNKTHVHSFGMTAGGGYPDPYREPGNNPPADKITFRGASLSGSYVHGGDKTKLEYMDMNGDGLPDKVWPTDKKVALNTGYGFQAEEAWDIPLPRKGASNSFTMSGGASFSYCQYSIGGGIGKNGSESYCKSMLMDVNGDGLPDMVEMGDSGLKVRYNYGNGQWSPSYDHVNQVYGISGSSSYSKSGDIDLTVGFSVGIVKMTVGVQTSPSNKNFTRDELQLTDVNGDGYPDFVTSDGETRMWIKYNTAGKTNLLKTVTNFTGSTITMDYDMPMSSYERPQRSWNLASVEVLDPASPLGGNRRLTTIEYGRSNYDRYERMDYGYDTVITKVYDTDHGDTLYRYTVDVYENRNFTKKGEKTYDCLFNAAGDKYVEHLYDAVIYHRDGYPSVDDDGLCANADLYIGEEYIETNYYEGLPSPQIVKLEQKLYDNHRNIIQYMHHGNQINFAEYFTADIQYAASIGHNMVSLPVSIEVKDSQGALLRKRTATYTPQGRLLQLTAHNTSGNSLYDFTYDCYGNMDTVWQPQNKNGQRLMYTYQYDTLVHIYPTKVTNESLGYYSTAEYDLRFGKPTKTVDVNQNEMRYFYDCIGRLSRVVAPNEIDSLVSNPLFFTIHFYYTPHHYGVLDIFRYDQSHPLLSWATTTHFDPQHPDTAGILTVVISDNLGRMVQTKKNAELNGQLKRIVSGKVEYDCFGRIKNQYHPSVDTTSREHYNPYFVSGTETSFEYDMLDRKTRIILPTHDTTLMEYGFGSMGGTTYFRTTTTDALHNVFTSLTGTLGQTVSQMAPGNTETTFIYDAIGQLKQSTDPDNISTFYDYDLFGQMVHRNHPDAGDDNYCYDQAGNLIAHTNSLGDSVIYKYHFNQLREIIYPRYPANNVHYQYGSLNVANLAINAVGRVVYQEDASGWQKFSYGKLGEVTKNMRTFALPCDETPYTFVMEYEYDSWNRIQKMTYPDGEVVSYQYDKGGMLKSVTGTKNGVSYKYIDSIKYNKFELKDAVYYGNGTHAHYTYDTLQRLSHVVSYTSPFSPGGTEMMQDLYYTYDSVSNITDVVNYALQLSNGLGGSYDNHYVYDNLYRLSNAEGHWHGISNLSYNLSMDYHDNGRVGHKSLTAGTLLNGNFSTVSYGRKYHYNTSSQKNTIIKIDGSENHDFQWDATGNMIYHRFDGIPGERFFCWDEENRLQGVKDKQHLSFYQYDANGERTYKLTGSVGRQNISGRWSAFYLLDNPTLYPSPYMVVTRKGYTKHYYAENERIASRIGGGGLSEIENPIVEWEVARKKALELNCTHLEQVLECLINPDVSVKNTLKDIYKYKDIVTQEKDAYWYHPDHLGSSSWITYTDGSAVQHLHYLPWGEDFVDQRSTNWNAMYTFSAKEKDAETGYSYFGVRYYSSDLSIWLSVDPMSDSIPYLTPYNYCKNSPILMKDPNGEFPWLVVWGLVEAGLAIYDAYQTGTTIVDPNASIGQKAASVGGFLLGAVLPGGGYGSGAKFGVKQAERLIKAGVTTGKRIDNIGGFASRELLKEHYIKHGKEFGGKFKNADEYLKGAQNFFKRESTDIIQYTRKNGEIVRYDMKNNIFGVADKNGNIRTMFKPDDGVNYLKKQIKTDLGIDGL